VLRDFPVGELKAVLAHEYGHFTNRDTAGGSFALAVRRSLLVMAHSLAQSGAAAWYNPAWLFVNGFFRVFLRISQGASRLQEVLADRWAAAAYGSEPFERGLMHVIAADARFRAHVGATLKEVVDGKLPLPNLYRYQPACAIEESELASSVDEELNRKPSPYDSHPAPADRIAWVRALGAVGIRAFSDGDPAWSLFADPDGLEQQMTAEVRDNVASNYGVEIPAVATAA
jgi:Zn-dependent protease with chaperone function